GGVQSVHMFSTRLGHRRGGNLRQTRLEAKFVPDFGMRWQAKRDTAFKMVSGVDISLCSAKATLPLRYADTLQKPTGILMW
ncbi:uncharacterized protein METZ01_LOCUS422359, partial [marine metagenome]